MSAGIEVLGIATLVVDDHPVIVTLLKGATKGGIAFEWGGYVPTTEQRTRVAQLAVRAFRSFFSAEVRAEIDAGNVESFSAINATPEESEATRRQWLEWLATEEKKPN